MTGVMAGAIDITRVSSARRAAARSAVAVSRTMARPSTRPLQPPIDCNTRATISEVAEGARLVAIFGQGKERQSAEQDGAAAEPVG